MRKSFSVLFLVVLMIQLCCPLVFGDVVGYSSPQETMIDTIIMLLGVIFFVFLIFSSISLLGFIYYYYRNKELSEEINTVKNDEEHLILNEEEKSDEVTNEKDLTKSVIYKEIIKEKNEKKLKKFEKLNFIFMYIFGIIFEFLFSLFIMDEFLYSIDSTIAFIISLGISLVIFCFSFFSSFVRRKLSESFLIVYGPIVLTLVLILGYSIFEFFIYSIL